MNILKIRNSKKIKVFDFILKNSKNEKIQKKNKKKQKKSLGFFWKKKQDWGREWFRPLSRARDLSG